VATALKERLRDTDMVARIGGDEFADIMPYARLELAVMISKGLQESLGECSVDIVGSSNDRLTASFGQTRSIRTR
jgi:diguanylate cyclase (GGDEF)-like protein